MTDQSRHHPLGIDRVLVATQRNERDAGPVLVADRVELVVNGRDIGRDIGANGVR